MTDQEINTAIAQWFEPKPRKVIGCSSKRFWLPDRDGDPIAWKDFINDETANAILRDAMPMLSIEHRGPSGWWIWPDPSTEAGCDILAKDTDYKRAIVGAFLQFIAANPKTGAGGGEGGR